MLGSFMRWWDGAKLVSVINGTVRFAGRDGFRGYSVMLYQGRKRRHVRFIGSMGPLSRTDARAYRAALAWKDGAELPGDFEEAGADL